jgi:outer membrane receptor for ferrienterochelin and colicin
MDRAVYGRMAVLLIAGSLCAIAQSTRTASVMGKVIDENDAPLVGAIARLSSPSLQGVRSVATDGKGQFVAGLLPPGDYLMEITKEGYQSLRLKQHLGMDQNFQPRFRMAKNVVVVVTAPPPAVDRSDVKTASNYRMDYIDQLPVGRTMEDIAMLTPSVVKGMTGGLQVRGSLSSANQILVDGQNVEDGDQGVRGVALIEDAIEETEVLTGAISAEYGNVDGAVINSITRSGSNVFSGKLNLTLSNPAWNASMPMIDRNTVEDRLGWNGTVSLGGYLIKDRLWFYTSWFNEHKAEMRTISADSLGGEAGASYLYKTEETRRQLKLTWLVNQDHTLVASYMNSDFNYHNKDIWAGSVAALEPQQNTDGLFSLDWRAIWSPHVVSDIRYGFKNEHLTFGTRNNLPLINQSPILNADDYLFYNHSPFNGDDGGDHRDNQSFAAKTSFFFDAFGSHQLDTGFDGTRSVRQAQSEISPTGYVFYVSNLDPINQKAVPLDVLVYQGRSGKVTIEHRALYANDKWIFNDHLATQLGLRWEGYEAWDESGSKLAGAGALSPRLGLKYDFKGDSKWLAGISYARYNGKLLDKLLTNATYQGNCQEIDYRAKDPSTSIPYSEIFDLTNYDFSAAGVDSAWLPGVNIRLNPDLKPPAVDEYQASLSYAFADTPIGTGYVKATGVYKNWTNLIDYSVGRNGQASYVLPGSGEILHPYITYWDNNPDATRRYKALELEFSTAKDRWQFSGNLTWSRLWGNYQGEEEGMPSRGEGLNAWDITDGQVMFDRNITAPTGDLLGNVPFRVRLMGTYTLDSRLGKTTFGLMYRFDSGTHESVTRYISGSALNPSLPPEGYYASFTQYLNNQRGTVTNHSSSYFDVAVNHELPLFTIKETPVKAFVRVVIKNVFNHQQLLTVPRVYASYPNSYLDSWVPADLTTFGRPNAACYGEPRTYSISAGFCF